MCHQLQGPKKSPAVQCRRCELAPGPMGCSCCRQRQWDTGWLPTQPGAGFTVELLLLEAQMFPWSNSKKTRLSRRHRAAEDEILSLLSEISPVQQWCWE